MSDFKFPPKTEEAILMLCMLTKSIRKEKTSFSLGVERVRVFFGMLA